MAIQRFYTGTRLSEMVIHNNTIYLAGQVPENTLQADAYQQTKEVLALVDKLLHEAGSDKTKILNTQIFLADMADYHQMNQAWDEWVAGAHAPARATVQAKLAESEWKVEIVITAAV